MLRLDLCTTLKLTTTRTRIAMISTKKQMNAGLYRVEGPAKLRVESGSFYALGRVYSQGNELVVPRGLVVCLKVETPCIVEISGGVMTEAKLEEEVIDQWKVLAETLAEPGRILVVGETDSGKTTFSTFILNTALSKGLSVALIDADVGQNDVGWPGTVALAYPPKPVSWLGELEPAAIYFVGSNTPMGCEDAVIVGVVKLMRKASGRDLVVVNTDGWIADRRALSFKARLVESVEPDTLVVMEGSGASEALARMFEGTKVRVVRAPTPPAAKAKERALRKMRREMSYMELLSKATVKQLKLREVKLWGHYTFNGRYDPRLSAALSAIMGFDVHAEECGSIVVLIASDDSACRKLQEAREQLAKLLNKETYTSCLSVTKGALVGLLDDRLECIGIGIVEEVNIRDGVIKMKTPFNVEGVRAIVFGRLRVSKEGIERERGPPPIA